MVFVAFVNVPTGIDPPLTVYPPVGILSMGAVLKDAGHKVDFVDADVLCLSPEEVCETFSRPPTIIGITLNIGQVALAGKYIEALRNRFPTAFLVAGGPYVTGVGERILDEFPTLDFAVTGEGELAITDLAGLAAGELDAKDVRNLIWRGGLGPVSNPIERINDLDALPLPDYSLVEAFIDRYPAPGPSIASPSLAIMCTRGCPYKCAFCTSPDNWGRRLTLRSVASVIQEVVLLKKRFGVREIFFTDDTLNARPKWFFQLTDAIIERNLHREIFFKAPFRVSRAILTEEILERAREAGFWMIFYGVESGNQAMLDRMGKGTTIEEIERAFQLTSQKGLCTLASFMVGNEGETQETFEDSLALLRRIRPDFGAFSVATPIPGSKLERRARASGHITKLDFRDFYWGDAILRTESLSTSDIVRLARKGNEVFTEVAVSVSSRNKHFKRILYNDDVKSRSKNGFSVKKVFSRLTSGLRSRKAG